MAVVTRISLAPVKSLRVVQPPEVLLTPEGVAGDRRFWLADGSGRLYNGKRDARLVLIRPDWDEGSRRLALELPGRGSVEGVVELGPEVVGEFFGEEVRARRVVGPWDDALASFLGEPVSLLWADRPVVDRHSLNGGVSLVSKASLERLRQEAAADGPVDGRRFRMLFEIDGVDAHAEDGWIGRELRIGEALVTVLGDVGRCVVTTRDPETGVVDLETLRVLGRYRPDGVTERLPFGIYGAVVEPGRVRVGDEVEPA